MNNTPVTILEKQIKFYEEFVITLKTRNGIDKNAPQDKLDNLICECQLKINEFREAIKILNENIRVNEKLFCDYPEWDNRPCISTFFKCEGCSFLRKQNDLDRT